MLFLLRKIRRKLLMKNKLTSYLLYAVGEIFLVVIGIIIAIQLNNWNASRKVAKENQALLINLINDLAQDTTRLTEIAYIDANSLSLKTASENCLRALELSYRKMDSQLADSLLSIPLTAGRPLINTETSIYEQLKETGRLYSLGSDSLREKIIQYYREAKKESIYNDSRNDRHRKAQDEIAFYHTVDLNRAYNQNFQVESVTWLFNLSSKEMKTFRLTLSTMHETQYNNYKKWIQLRKQAKELIQAIEDEV